MYCTSIIASFIHRLCALNGSINHLCIQYNILCIHPYTLILTLIIILTSRFIWCRGGTSTDVSRYDGVYEHVFESTTAGI